jgi:hypothetical protein
MALTDTPPDLPSPGDSRLRKILPFTTIGVIIAALYVAWIFYSRHESEAAAQRALDAKQEEQRQRTVSTVFGNGEIKFSMFSADRGLLKRGEKTELCYGVVNAKTVKLDPPVEDIKPTYRHCLDIAPTKTTTYTITADDGAGHTKSSTLTVRVE